MLWWLMLMSNIIGTFIDIILEWCWLFDKAQKQCQALLAITGQGELITKINNNKVMCRVSMKLSDMFDSNSMHSSDKTVGKHISVKQTYSLVLNPKVKVIAKSR